MEFVQETTGKTATDRPQSVMWAATTLELIRANSWVTSAQTTLEVRTTMQICWPPDTATVFSRGSIKTITTISTTMGRVATTLSITWVSRPKRVISKLQQDQCEPNHHKMVVIGTKIGRTSRTPTSCKNAIFFEKERKFLEKKGELQG